MLLVFEQLGVSGVFEGKEFGGRKHFVGIKRRRVW